MMTEFLTLEDAMQAEARELVAAGERATESGDDAELERVAAALRDLGARHLGHAAALDRARELLLPHWPDGATFGEAFARAQRTGDSTVVGEIRAMMA